MQAAINGVEVVREVNGRSLMDYSRTDAIRAELRRFQVKGADGRVDHTQTLAPVLRVISKINNQKINLTDLRDFNETLAEIVYQ